MAELQPDHAIVPILRVTRSPPDIKELLGTGFFVGVESQLHLITAKHVVEQNPLQAGEEYAIAFHGKNAIGVFAARDVIASPDYDLAAVVLARPDLPEAVTLAISKVEPALNTDILSYEYSSTRIARSGTRKRVSFEPYAHKGSIVRSFESTYPEKVSTPSFLTSFPALQGASGAPIIMATKSKKGFAVVGMTVANVERQLLPAQLVQIHDGDSYSESTSYFLPYGKALGLSVIVKCLEEMGVPFSYAEDGEQA